MTPVVLPKRVSENLKEKGGWAKLLDDQITTNLPNRLE
jgi:hypothetical protein